MTWGFSQLICPLTWTFLRRPGIPGSFPTLGTRFSSAQLNRSGTAHWAAFFSSDFGLAPGFCLSYHIPILYSTDSTPSTLLTFRPPVPSRALDSCPLWGGQALQVGQMPTVSWKGFLAHNSFFSSTLTLGSLWIETLCCSLLPGNIPSYEQTTSYLSIISGGLLGLFLLSAIGVTAATSIWGQGFAWARALSFRRYTPSCEGGSSPSACSCSRSCHAEAFSPLCCT